MPPDKKLYNYVLIYSTYHTEVKKISWHYQDIKDTQLQTN